MVLQYQDTTDASLYLSLSQDCHVEGSWYHASANPKPEPEVEAMLCSVLERFRDTFGADAVRVVKPGCYFEGTTCSWARR
jgi:hypothetical protein